MNSANSPEATPGVLSENLEPFSIIIFGASGDLTARKLIPALYHLYKDKQMPDAFRIMAAGIARRPRPVFADETGG